MLEYIKIDGTNLVSSRIALGTWAIGGWMWGGTDEKESIRTIHAAFDQGVNLIDTAPVLICTTAGKGSSLTDLFGLYRDSRLCSFVRSNWEKSTSLPGIPHHALLGGPESNRW